MTRTGFLTEAQIIARYTERSERDMSRFGLDLALAAFKLAATLEGVQLGLRIHAASRTSLFFRENSAMLFGDARDRVEDSVKAL